MSWSTLSIQSPIGDFANSPAVITVDPCQNGCSTLSFPSAIDALSKKLQISDGDAMLAVAVIAQSLADFSSALAGFNGVFPIPEFERLQRRADKVGALESTKFQLVKPSVKSKPLNLNSLDAIRETYRQKLIDASMQWTDTFKVSNAQTNLTTFDAEKTARAAANAVTPPPPANTLITGSAWRFYAETDILTAVSVNHPSHDYQFTAIICFVAPVTELAALAGVFT